MLKQRLFLIEDAKDVADLIQRGLAEEGFDVELAACGKEALRKIERGWDLIILDLMLPDIAGEEILDFLASKTLHRPPVLVLTAKSELESKLDLFKRGCDDYLTKPFAFEELLVRVQALLRRTHTVSTNQIEYEDMKLEPSKHQLCVGREKIDLTPKEFNMLRILMREPGRVVSKMELIRSVWGLGEEPSTNFLDVHLANLRKKLSRFDRHSWLKTKRHAGFIFYRPESNGP